jgi:hypothetical protein
MAQPAWQLPDPEAMAGPRRRREMPTAGADHAPPPPQAAARMAAFLNQARVAAIPPLAGAAARRISRS